MQVLQGSITAGRIPSDNVGFKLLRKLGWTGGAIGKNSSANVIQLAPIVGYDDRAGIGFARSAAFRPAVRHIISEFVQSDGRDDIVFSAELTSEERDIVCAEARKNHLQFRCHHKGPAVEDVYVIVSLQRSPMEVVNYLLKNGGENHKYCLQEPCKV